MTNSYTKAFLVLLVSFASIAINSVGADSIETLVFPEDCLKDQYYDSTQMICSNCSDNLLIVDTARPAQDSRYSNDYTLINLNGDNPLSPDSPDDGTTDNSFKRVEKETGNFIHSSLDHFSCRCPEGYFKTRGDNRYLYRCFKCPEFTVTSISGYECAKCLQNKVYQHEHQEERNPTESSSKGPAATTSRPSSSWMSLVRPATVTSSNETSVTEIPNSTTTTVKNSIDSDRGDAPKVTCLDNCDHLKNSFINERVNENGQLEKYCHQCPNGSRANQLELRCDPCYDSLILKQPIQQQRLSARLMHLYANNHQNIANQKELQYDNGRSSLSCRCEESDGYSLLAGTCLTHQSHQAILNEFLALSHNTVGLDTNDLYTNRRDILAGVDIGSTIHYSSIDSPEYTTQHVLNKVRFFDSDETQVDDIDGDTAYLNNELSSDRTKQPSKIIISEFIAKNLVSAIDQCKNHRNLTACQMWSNMCVMTIYSHHDTHHSMENTPTTAMHMTSNIHRKVTLQASNVCNYLKEHLKKSPLGRKSDIANIFVENEAIDELYKVNIPNTYKINQEVQFIAFRWNSRGHLLGASEFKLDELRICSASSGRVSSSKKINSHNKFNDRSKQGFNNDFPFGRNFHEICDIPIDALISRLVDKTAINEGAGIFYDVYLVIHTNDVVQIRPVPVLIKNLSFNGQHINRNDDISRWRLVRRFFLTDIIISTSADLPSTNLSNAKTHHYLRYPRSIDLNIRLRKRDGTGSIYPPLLTIDYGSVEITDIIDAESSNRTSISSLKKSMDITAELRITYSMSNSNLEKNGEALLGLLCLLSGFWSLIKSYTWCKRCGKTSIDLWTIFQYFILMGNMLANLLLLTIFVITFYCLAVYKFQTAPFTILPTRQQESSIITYIIAAFILKTVGLMNEFYWRINSDIFFLDWERPKQPSLINQHQHINNISTKSLSDNNHDEKQKTRLVDTNATNDQKLCRVNCFDNSGRSIWRCYSIYNRWLFLQTKRRINIIFQLFVSISILELTGLIKLATYSNNMDPAARQLNEPTSLTCRMAIIMTVYIIVAIGQISFRVILYEPLIKDTVREFIDLCSISNISLFGMLYPKYGYYIHGRSANGMAECNLQELNEFLEREVRDLCSKRGLAPNTDQQTFRMLLPTAINKHYHKLLDRDDLSPPLLAKSDSTGATKSNGFTTNSFSFYRPDIDRLVARHWLINRFLTNFIDHGFKDLDYTIRDKKTSEVLLDMEIEEHQDSAHFYNDGTSFISLIWLGMELDLVIFELMLVTVVDVWLNNLLAAVIITWVLNRLMKLCYCNLTRQNLVTKALIDDKFLVY